MVTGTFRSFSIRTNAGLFSWPSSIVMKTIFSLVGTFDITGTGPWAVSATGLTAGGPGAGASGFSPHVAQGSAAPADGLGESGALNGEAAVSGREEGDRTPCAAAAPLPLVHPVTAVVST